MYTAVLVVLRYVWTHVVAMPLVVAVAVLVVVVAVPVPVVVVLEHAVAMTLPEPSAKCQCLQCIRQKHIVQTLIEHVTTRQLVQCSR